MRHLVRSVAATTAAFLLLATGVLAQTGENCSRDVLAVDDGAVTATFCVPRAPAARVEVTESFSRGTQTFTRPLAIDVVSGATVTRAVDDVPLDALGSSKQLHLTLAYRTGEVVLEHALLLPGAVILK